MPSKPLPVAYYIGSQARLTGAPVDLFNLLVPLPSIDRTVIHPIESTVSAQTLRANGIRVPRELIIGQRLTTIARESANKACALGSARLS